MQKMTKLQDFIFTIIMAFVMVYAMICYNIALNKGGLSNEVFLLAFRELMIMWPVAIILEFFVVGGLARMIAFKIVKPGEDKPFVITLAISAVIVCIMCPIMSFIATLLFKDAGSQIFAVWLQTFAFNFPMAFIWQIFYAGPFVRFITKPILPIFAKQ
ncbi:Protein of unknown function [Lachnospiraceae bacterium C7]|nr:Protein of unknown function [Lachnospiraceae bacterium C7]